MFALRCIRFYPRALVSTPFFFFFFFNVSIYKLVLYPPFLSSQVTNSHNTATATKMARVAAVYIAKKTSAAMSKKRRSALLVLASIKLPGSPSAYGGRLG